MLPLLLQPSRSKSKSACKVDNHCAKYPQLFAWQKSVELAHQNTAQVGYLKNVLIQCISDYSIKLPVLGAMLLYLLALIVVSLTLWG